MAAFNKVNAFVEALAEGKHDLGSDTLKILLTNVAPSAADDAVKADLTEIAAGNGYSAGGATVTVLSSAQSGGTYKLIIADVTLTASGGAIADWRYAVLYNDTATDDDLIGWWDKGSTVSIGDGEQFLLDFDGSAGVLQLS